jgi:hypothetical protein
MAGVWVNVDVVAAGPRGTRVDRCNLSAILRNNDANWVVCIWVDGNGIAVICAQSLPVRGRAKRRILHHISVVRGPQLNTSSSAYGSHLLSCYSRKPQIPRFVRGRIATGEIMTVHAPEWRAVRACPMCVGTVADDVLDSSWQCWHQRFLFRFR